MKLTKQQKPYVIGGIAALILIILLRRKTSEQQEATALQTEAGQSGNATYPQSQFYAWANRLEQSMFDIGTDEDAIFSVFNQLRNNADFLALKQAFGVRQYTGGFLPGFMSDDLSLEGWIAQEFDSDEINQLNNILRNKGINYQI
jgi:hypothetical protein